MEDICNSDGYVESVGVLLRDPVTKKGLISCHFPVDHDCTNQMLWVPIDERPVEAVPIYTREVGSGYPLKNVWKRIKDRISDDEI